jgi:gas vesicle protein
MIGGPLGAAIGAVAGAVIGAIGSSHAARDYDLKTVRPRIANDLQAYHSGGMNYMDAYSDGQSLEMEAQTTTKKMGSADSRYYNNTILPEIKEFMGKLTSEQKAGRSQYTASGASYATGTPYVPQTGLNMNHAGERIFSSVDNSQITKAITEGNRGTMPVQPASMGDVHLHVHAIDAKGVSQFLDKYKHNIRSAVNDSYAENSGGGMN